MSQSEPCQSHSIYCWCRASVRSWTPSHRCCATQGLASRAAVEHEWTRGSAAWGRGASRGCDPAPQPFVARGARVVRCSSAGTPAGADPHQCDARHDRDAPRHAGRSSRCAAGAADKHGSARSARTRNAGTQASVPARRSKDRSIHQRKGRLRRHAARLQCRAHADRRIEEADGAPRSGSAVRRGAALPRSVSRSGASRKLRRISPAWTRWRSTAISQSTRPV